VDNVFMLCSGDANPPGLPIAQRAGRITHLTLGKEFNRCDLPAYTRCAAGKYSESGWRLKHP
jgi:hypothetical protein